MDNTETKGGIITTKIGNMNMMTFTTDDIDFALQCINMGIHTIDEKVSNDYDSYTIEDLCIMFGREYDEKKLDILLQTLSKR